MRCVFVGFRVSVIAIPFLLIGKRRAQIRWPEAGAPRGRNPKTLTSFSRWPPNSQRMAERTLSAKSSIPLELKRLKSADPITGAGTPSSIAACNVQRPSPESDTRPAKPVRSGFLKRASAVKSRSHEPITLPRRHTSAMSGSGNSYFKTPGGATARSLRPQPPQRLPMSAFLKNIYSFGNGGHHPVLYAVVDHFYKMSGAVGAAVQIAVFGGRGGP